MGVLFSDKKRQIPATCATLLGHLHDPVAPVVGALGVLLVVDVVEGRHDVGSGEVAGVVEGPVSGQSVVVLLDPGLQSGLDVALELDRRLVELVLEVLGTVEPDAGL